MSGILQIVDGDGDFAESELQNYIKDNGIETSGVNYTIVAIMGPQSSGKSTLLNHLFGTHFEEMDALSGRQQTTHGIWLAPSPKVKLPPTIVMDLEGSDGRERGEDDTSFERQSALFALATSDILLVNMWAKDVGRESGAGKPLLKTIFQVNLKLFQPSPGARRTVLLFVFRDRTRTPLEKLRETWEQDLQDLWDSIAKPPVYTSCSIRDFFDVQYYALSNYEERQEDFLAETTILRRKFTEDVDESEGYLRTSPHKLPGQAVALSMSKVWEVIRDNKDLNLPAHRVMVANIRCAEIAQEVAASFASSILWVKIASEAEDDLVPGFGKKVGTLLEEAIDSYAQEARYFDSSVSASRQETLIEELHSMIKPVFDHQLDLARRIALESYIACTTAMTLKNEKLDSKREEKGNRGEAEEEEEGRESFVQCSARCATAAISEFDQTALDILLLPSSLTEWTSAPAKEALKRDILHHESKVRSERSASAVDTATRATEHGVSEGAMPLLESPPVDLWSRLSSVVERESKNGIAVLTRALRGYGVPLEEEAALQGQIREAALRRLHANAKEAANTVLPRLKDRFSESFHRDEDGMPRTWNPSVDITAVAREARRNAALLLAQLCIVRRGGNEEGKEGKEKGYTGGEGAHQHNDNKLPHAVSTIEKAILKLAEENPRAASITTAPTTTATTTDIDEFDVLSASEWPDIPKEDVLLTPMQVRTAWRQFVSDSALSVQQAVATQEANKLAQNRLPPLWTIAVMVVLGFNEFVAVLRNPLYLLLLIIVFAFAKTVYQELDVESEMQMGLLPGAMALSAKFMPTVKVVAQRTIESGKRFLQDGAGGDEEVDESSSGGAGDGAVMNMNAVGGGRSDGLRARRPEVGWRDD